MPAGAGEEAKTMRKAMMMVAVLVLASAASADPVRSGRVFELRRAVAAPVAPASSCAAVIAQAAAARPAPESKKDCGEFAGVQMLRFFAGSVQAMKDSRGQLAMPGGEGVRIVAY